MLLFLDALFVSVYNIYVNFLNVFFIAILSAFWRYLSLLYEVQLFFSVHCFSFCFVYGNIFLVNSFTTLHSQRIYGYLSFNSDFSHLIHSSLTCFLHSYKFKIRPLTVRGPGKWFPPHNSKQIREVTHSYPSICAPPPHFSLTSITCPGKRARGEEERMKDTWWGVRLWAKYRQ